MAKARALDKRRKSIRNIRKITRTMELIATARFKRAMDRATAATAYTRRITALFDAGDYPLGAMLDAAASEASARRMKYRYFGGDCRTSSDESSEISADLSPRAVARHNGRQDWPSSESESPN